MKVKLENNDTVRKPNRQREISTPPKKVASRITQEPPPG
jgi:hypothetical protein